MDNHNTMDPFADWGIKTDKTGNQTTAKEGSPEGDQTAAKVGGPEGGQTSDKEGETRKEEKAERKAWGLFGPEKEDQEGEAGRKTIAPYIATVFIVLVFGVLVSFFQANITLVSLVKDMQNALDHVSTSYVRSTDEWETYEREVDMEYCRLLDVISRSINKNSGERESLLAQYSDRGYFENLLILDKECNILAQAHPTDLDFHEQASRELNKLVRIEYTNAVNVYSPKGVDGSSQGMVRYYASSLQDGNVLVGQVQCDILNQISDHRTSWEALLGQVGTRMGGQVLVLKEGSWDVVYAPKGSNILGDGGKVRYSTIMKSDNLGLLTCGGKSYYTVTYSLNDEIRLAVFVAQGRVRHYVFQTVFVLLLIFISMVLVMLIYSVYASNEQKRGREAGWKKIREKRYYNREIGRRLFLCAIFGTIAIGITTFYVQTLTGVTGNARNTEESLKKAVTALDDSKSDVSDARDFVNNIRKEFCDIFLTSLNDYETIAQEDMFSLEMVSHAKSISVYNMDGERVIESSMFLDYDKNAIKEKIRKVSYAMWTKDYYLGEEGSELGEEGLQEIASFIKDKAGQEYLVLINLASCRLPGDLQKATLEDSLGVVTISNGGYAFAINNKSGNFSYHPNSDLVGQSAKSCGLDEDKLVEGYTGDMDINGTKCIVSIAEEKTDILGTAISRSQALVSRIPSTLLSVGASLLCFLVLLHLLAFRKDSLVGVAEPGFMKKLNKGKSAETIASRIIMVYLLVLAIVISLISLLGHYFLPGDSLLLYALEGSWTKGINIFSLTLCIINVAEGMLIILFVRKLLKALEDTFSTRGATVCRLCASLCKYFGMVLIIYKCVADFGVNTATLLTSAGILTTVVGLGAKSLLEDIFAGLFIIFEGDLQVSDVVEYDDFLGTIEEIGIRTTKIRSVDNNTKILNNKDITKIIDRPKNYNYCHVYVMVNHKESLERIEALLARDLPDFPDKFPFLYGEPEYRGVVSLTDGGMTLDIRFKTSPRYIIEVENEMNREIQKLFTEYGIELNIPYVMNQMNKQALPAAGQDAELAHDYLRKRWNNRVR